MAHGCHAAVVSGAVHDRACHGRNIQSQEVLTVTTHDRMTFTRRKALLGGTALLAAAGLTGVHSHRASGSEMSERPAATWGRIANSSRHGQRILTGLFFGGPPNPNSLPLYTRHPATPNRLDWTDQSDIRFALRQFASTGLNTIKLSYFGHQGETDRFAPAWLFSQQRWPGDGEGTYTEAEQIERARQLFTTAAELDLLVAPMVEVGLDFFRFWQDFPFDLTELVARAGWLLRNFGDEPNFLRVYDSQGQPRPVVWLIETIHVGPVTPQDFAAGFDRAAQLLHEQTGHRPGWIVDPTPLPGYGSHDGPDPAVLRGTPSVLAVNPFNITSQGLGERKDQPLISEDERLAYARSIMTTWTTPSSGIPFIAPILPGYDAHIVFPPPQHDTAIYGFHPDWLLRQQQLAVEFGTDGLSVDTYNGWTEGHAIPPSLEDGDTQLDWLHETIAALRHRWAASTS
jgi:hypothetical protein